MTFFSNLGPHAGFILAAYGAAGLILTLLIGWIVAENRALNRQLAELQSRGITRRSDARRAPMQKSAA